MKFYILNIIFEILTLMAIKNAVFWYFTRYGLVDIYLHFGGTFMSASSGQKCDIWKFSNIYRYFPVVFNVRVDYNHFK